MMASDSHPAQPFIAGNNVHLSVSYDKNEKMEDAFNKLAQGGKVIMPIGPSFWGSNFGMLTDKFGVHWMFSQKMN